MFIATSYLSAAIRRLVHVSSVSEPSMIRFYRALSCKGFQDFRMRLARDLATGAQFSDNSLALGVALNLGSAFENSIRRLKPTRFCSGQAWSV